MTNEEQGTYIKTSDGIVRYHDIQDAVHTSNLDCWICNEISQKKAVEMCVRCKKTIKTYSTGLCQSCEDKDRILMDYWSWKESHYCRLGLWVTQTAQQYDVSRSFVYDAINLNGTFWKPADEIRVSR